MTGNLASIQYLRAIAAIIVVYFHTKVYLPDVPFDVPRQFGFSGVDIFFVVSGFIIFMVTADNRDTVGVFFGNGSFVSRRFTGERPWRL